MSLQSTQSASSGWSALKGEGGFTLLELLISLLILSFSMLGLTTLFTLQAVTNANAIRHNAMNTVVLGMVEKARSVPYYRINAWDPSNNSAAIPCQGLGSALKADRIDCLRPDTSDATVPPSPYNEFVSDADFIPITALPGDQLRVLNTSFSKGISIKRTYSIVPDSPQADMKTITARVDWKVSGQSDVHSVTHVIVRDMDVR
ncbi:MAG: prepilin-type N-terminal cleavage/methylation domain-containing protein [Leptospirillia bacterium]